LHHREVGRLGALEYAAGVDPDVPKRLDKARAVTHQAARLGELSHSKDGRNRMARRQGGDLRPARLEAINSNLVRVDRTSASSQ
jgi:hypothetical protein